MSVFERLAVWWREHRPCGGTIETVSCDLHRDPLIRVRGLR